MSHPWGKNSVLAINYSDFGRAQQVVNLLFFAVVETFLLFAENAIFFFFCVFFPLSAVFIYFIRYILCIALCKLPKESSFLMVNFCKLPF